MNLHHSLKWNGRKDGCLDQIKATPWASCLASPKTAKSHWTVLRQPGWIQRQHPGCIACSGASPKTARSYCSVPRHEFKGSPWVGCWTVLRQAQPGSCCTILRQAQAGPYCIETRFYRIFYTPFCQQCWARREQKYHYWAWAKRELAESPEPHSGRDREKFLSTPELQRISGVSYFRWATRPGSMVL